jgi:hypothetical protein
MMEYDDQCKSDPTMPLKYPYTHYNIHLANLVIINLCTVMMSQSGDIIDGQNLEEEDISIEIAGSMGAMERKNFFTVGNTRMRINKSDNMIAQLQYQLKNVEENIREEVSKRLEQTRAAERLEIQLLKTSLDEMN